MGYHYEQLGPERFQELAQAIIRAEHPDVALQCLPVGQPDGGRDAFTQFFEPDEAGFAVYQVKYTRAPENKDERDAITDLIKSEKPKVKELISRGAKRYYFVTNVKGTAHLDGGSVDKANAALTEAFGIPTEVWWRDDLDRRIDVTSDIKWSFLDICRATDLVQFLLERPENKEKLEAANAVRAYFSAQYAADRDVKFKQADLKKRLTELFVDLPLSLKQSQESERRRRVYEFDSTRPINMTTYLAELGAEEDFPSNEDSPFRHGALTAAYLLQMPLFSGVSRFVVEGAPGQGKSTVTQFLCQVNRLRLTEKAVELQNVGDGHKIGPVRAPFRIDLRDYARWITGHHPFATDAGDQVPREGMRSLESFMVMQVSFYAGGLKLTHQELIEFFKRSHSVVVLDGFDEVADIATRGKVVEEICQAAARLDGLALSIQMIVTSRPAAFANSPGFPEDDWVHLELKDLKTGNISAYREKWCQAQGLSTEDQALVKETLTDKLEQPHLRDLARNPMQLAILLHLIYAQGPALPDKRTALYEEYMKLFFNREVEKSPIVREHRALLLEIHGLLAWRLQTEAEEGSGAGSITKENLHRLVRDYLEAEGHEEDLAGKLLTGTVERVGALVSRVEGTYEFEVQPLREYFTALHLYETASLSPAGRPQKGTRVDRFDALARSFYWTNVTRFFCGFYGKAELPSLVDGLTQLGEQDGYDLVNQPRRLTMMLLSDRVFSQSPRTQKQLIERLVEEPGFQRLTAQQGNVQQRDSMGLPDTAGRKQLFEACAARLDREGDRARRQMLRQVMAANADPEVLKLILCERFKSGATVCDPMSEARDFGVLARFTTQEILTFTETNHDLRLRWLSITGRFTDMLTDDALYRAAFHAFAKNRLQFRTHHTFDEDDMSVFECLTELLNGHNFVAMFSHGDRYESRVIMQRRYGLSTRRLLFQAERIASERSSDPIAQFVKFVAERVFERKHDWLTSLRPWSQVVNRGFALAPGAHVFVRTALISTAIDARFKVELEDETEGKYELKDGEAIAVVESTGDDPVEPEGEEYWGNEGFEPTAGLVERLRYARHRAADEAWWQAQFESARGPAMQVALAGHILWANPAVLSETRTLIDTELDRLDSSAWFDVASWVNMAAAATVEVAEPLTALWLIDQPKCLARLSYLFFSRIAPDDEYDKIHRIAARRAFSDYDGKDWRIIRYAASVELSGVTDDDVDWAHVAKLSRRARQSELTMFASYPLSHSWNIPPEVAREVLEDCEEHCSQWVAVCERDFASGIAQNARRVSEIADADGWFATPTCA